VRFGLALLALAGAAAIWRLHEAGEEPATLRRELERARFEDWISDGRLPDDGDHRTVAVGLLYDERTSEYAVIDGDTRYRYEEREPAPPEAPDRFEWPDIGIGEDGEPTELPESLAQQAREFAQRARDRAERAFREDRGDAEGESEGGGRPNGEGEDGRAGDR
jgi:hypothetical protein